MNKEPCCDWVGADGAGHYVKMVHNGIEYGDMQVRLEREREREKMRESQIFCACSTICFGVC